MKVKACRELTGGYFNAAYEVLLSDEKELVLKVGPLQDTDTLSYERNIMSAEVSALQLIRSKGTVPVPKVLFYDDSRSKIAGEYFFMEKVHGEPYSDIKDGLQPDQRAAVETELGRYNRMINEIRGERFGLYSTLPRSGGRSWRETFQEIIGDLLNDARRLGAVMPVPLERIEEEVAKLLPALEEVTEPRLVHWDLWDGNVFVKGGKIVALIDWERALWGDPLMEYYFRYIEDTQHFLRGYHGVFDSPNERARIRLYDLYIDLIYFIECYSRKYDSAGHFEWAHDNLLAGWERFLK
ncbi:Predicted kinase, aminoglycoside phosphotransferase (APT) family [Paenibacillus sp. NFR01]|nr:Predicted kinase, aminoglycoside phosphotransferase (APT) family [Paenibacillus sp. NFR01]